MVLILLRNLYLYGSKKTFFKKLLNKNIQSFDKSFNEDKVFFSEHHFSHAASAFYPSLIKKQLY